MFFFLLLLPSLLFSYDVQPSSGSEFDGFRKLSVEDFDAFASYFHQSLKREYTLLPYKKKMFNVNLDNEFYRLKTKIWRHNLSGTSGCFEFHDLFFQYLLALRDPHLMFLVEDPLVLFVDGVSLQRFGNRFYLSYFEEGVAKGVWVDTINGRACIEEIKELAQVFYGDTRLAYIDRATEMYFIRLRRIVAPYPKVSTVIEDGVSHLNCSVVTGKTVEGTEKTLYLPWTMLCLEQDMDEEDGRVGHKLFFPRQNHRQNDFLTEERFSENVDHIKNYFSYSYEQAKPGVFYSSMLNVDGYNIAYCHVPNFAFKMNESENLLKALEKYKNADALLVDLRGNPGGLVVNALTLLHACVGDIAKTISLYIPDIADRDTARQVYKISLTDEDFDTKNRIFHDTPILVLVDAKTCSAAETFAYAVQKAGAGMVVGIQTPGAAGVVRDFVITNSLKISKIYMGCYLLNIDGDCIETVGVIPSIFLDYVPGDIDQQKPFLGKVRRCILDMINNHNSKKEISHG